MISRQIYRNVRWSVHAKSSRSCSSFLRHRQHRGNQDKGRKEVQEFGHGVQWTEEECRNYAEERSWIRRVYILIKWPTGRNGTTGPVPLCAVKYARNSESEKNSGRTIHRFSKSQCRIEDATSRGELECHVTEVEKMWARHISSSIRLSFLQGFIRAFPRTTRGPHHSLLGYGEMKQHLLSKCRE